MRRFIASLFAILLISAGVLYSQVGNTGRQYTATSPISISGNNISCPTCGSGTGTVNPCSNTTSSVAYYGTNSSTVSCSRDDNQPPNSAGTLDYECNGTSFGSGGAPWTAVNLGGATISESGGYCNLTVPAEATNNIRGYSQPVPGATPWAVEAKISILGGTTGAGTGGIFISDGTKFYVLGPLVGGASNLGTFTTRYTNSNTFSANEGTAIYTGLKDVYLYIQNDGTNITFKACLDPEVTTCFQTFTETKATFLGAITTVGFYGQTQNNVIEITMMDWFRRVQ